MSQISLVEGQNIDKVTVAALVDGGLLLELLPTLMYFRLVGFVVRCLLRSC